MFVFRTLLPQKLKIALYSHDSQGLGHVRRNLSITESFSRCYPSPSTLLIVGAREAAQFSTPHGVDYLSLPAISKELPASSYRSRSLDVPLDEVVALRAGAIRGAIEAFSPDVFIVDKHPLGFLGELEKTLEYLQDKGGARCVFGLRDVLDHPSCVSEEWRRQDNDAVISAYYDEMWVYSDPGIYDPITECGICREKPVPIRYTGYLGRGFRPTSKYGDHSHAPPGITHRYVLCMVGGGQDGFELAEAFVQAELPPHTSGILITGPFMPPDDKQKLHLLACEGPRLRILEFYKWPELLLQSAHKVVAMGGYNTVCEILSFKKEALIVPRVKPRREQLVRARRLQELDLLDMLHPAELTPAALSEWIARDTVRRPFQNIDLSGCERVSHLLAELVSQESIQKCVSNAGVARYGII